MRRDDNVALGDDPDDAAASPDSDQFNRNEISKRIGR
jgi:hypothetical protein